MFLQEACPSPTILQVAPGSTVTFTNEDAFAHNIIGNLWGHYDDLNRGDTFTATFDEAGVYPYACWYHPGMTGAIVVGSGMGAGNGATVSLGSVALPSPSPVAVVASAESVRTETPGAVGWIAGGAIGLALGAGAVLLLRRRRAA